MFVFLSVNQWEVKAPMPSSCFRSIVRQISKLHEAIYGLLPSSQVQVCFVKNCAVTITFFWILQLLKDSWKEYMEKLTNEENEWDHKISAEVKEGPADSIRMDELRAALKKMKRYKAPGLSGVVTEIIQATGDIGTTTTTTV